MSYHRKSLIKFSELPAACAAAGYLLEIDAAGRFRRLRRLPSAAYAPAAGRAALNSALEALARASTATAHLAFAPCAWCGGQEAEIWAPVISSFRCICCQCGGVSPVARSPAAAIEAAWDRIGGLPVTTQRARGPARGRPRVRLDTTALLRLAAGDPDITVARDCGVSRATLYRWLVRLRTVRITLPDEPCGSKLGFQAIPAPSCPHCGKVAHAAQCAHKQHDTWRVFCFVCAAMGPLGFGVQGAYAQWLRRPVLPQAAFSST